ncbi:MAG: type II toxin-antitoxin system RelE/ParE family toxin [Bacteroidia bacterium]|jgi:toxin ParE1/3/4|tara:strand:+ start:994 stop:1284 length:291 start_codon:yes stop_codon:yes gene_type:complete
MAVYKFSLKAEEDISDIFEYSIETFGIAQAEKYYQALTECLDRLVQFPNLGRDSTELHQGLKLFYFQSHSIYYSLDKHDLIIVRIISNHMDAARHV